MAAGRQDRQPHRDRAADVKQREPVDGGVGLVETVNLGETPGGMNLIAVRQADEFRMPGRPAGVEQRAHGVAIGSELKIELVVLPRERRIETDHVPVGIAFGADHQHGPQRRHAPDHRVGFLPDLRIVGFGRDHQHRGVFRDQQIGHRVGGEQIIDRAGRAGDLSPNQGDRYRRQRRAEEGDGAAAGADAERSEQIGGTRHAAKELPVRPLSRGFVGVAAPHHGQSGPVRMKERGRLEHLVQVTRGHDLVVGRTLQRHDICYRLNGLGVPCRLRRSRHCCHRSVSCRQGQWIAAYMIFSSVASSAENSSTTLP